MKAVPPGIALLASDLPAVPDSAITTKSKIELGVTGRDCFFEDINVWNAEPAKP